MFFFIKICKGGTLILNRLNQICFDITFPNDFAQDQRCSQSVTGPRVPLRFITDVPAVPWGPRLHQTPQEGGALGPAATARDLQEGLIIDEAQL